MPVIHVEMWPGRTTEQKQELARAITEAMVRIARVTPEGTIIIFDEVQKENWAQGGSLAANP
jgi:4-oxalocrotonate tautomerase